MATTDSNLDLDTRTKGTRGPFERWEGDLTGLVHVLWSARNNGWTLTDNADDIAAMILQSRALAARVAGARADAVQHAAHFFRDMAQETLSRHEVIDLLDNLAKQEAG